jgi:ketosteroid isomerase-like protein
MKPTSIFGTVFSLALLSPLPAVAQATAELDGFWAEMSRTVAEGDFAGYAALYHPDAVLVSLGANVSHPIADALAGWKQGFDDTRAGMAAAGVEFRFTQRLHDASTAHETGIFRYTLDPEEGDPIDAMVHFEGLLVKKDGRWQLVMEYQKQPATNAEWEAAGE